MTRPATTARTHMVSAGQALATDAAFAILEAGGNAVDAGVAAAIALGVVHSDQVQFSGVAPIMVYSAEEDRVWTISGLGPWPRAASLDLFCPDGQPGAIPETLLRTVVPAAPDAFLTALERFGTMTFGDVAEAAIRYARDGFPVHRVMATFLSDHAHQYRKWPQNAAIYMRDGEPLREGDLIVQADLAQTIQYMVDEERAASAHGRSAGLAAARHAFYEGDIAATITAFHRDNGGLLTMEDLAGFRVEVEEPVRHSYAGIDVLACPPWCQGPILLQMLSLLDGTDLKALGHNSPAYIHHLAGVMDLCFADRERYFGDPRFIDVPLDVLLSPEYAASRRRLIDPDRAFPEMPPAGEVGGSARPWRSKLAPATQEPGLPGDTSTVAVVDRHGNAFSCSPSDVSWEGPIIPGLGFCPSSRGSQSFAILGHASVVAPGKRPRLTPNPSIAMRRDAFLMPFGAPGGDMQPQGMLQVFLNHVVFGMEIQDAIDAPRFVTRNFPDSFEPHPYYPGRLDLERGIGEPAGETLASIGHNVSWLPDLSLKTAGVHAVVLDHATGGLSGGADPRRTGSVLGA